MRRRENISIDEYYHLYNRGVDKRIIFNSNKDKDRFQHLLYLCNGTKSITYRDIKDQSYFDVDVGDKIVAIGAYCLMGNHFHILAKEIVENGISLFMKKLLTAYSMYFNSINHRTGALFENRFKTKRCDTDEYLKYMFSYIHLNPLKMFKSNWKDLDKNELVEFADNLARYKYSSYIEYFDMSKSREEDKIITKESFPDYFSEIDGDSVIEWLTYTEDGPM